MCEIFYYKGKQNTVVRNLKQSFNKIKHRGPDNSTFINNKDIYRYSRLSIINTSNEGNQPLKLQINKKSPGCYLICNGQIYNYKELALKHEIKFK